MKIYKFSI